MMKRLMEGISNNRKAATPDLIVDLLNALSAIKALSELSCELTDDKTLIRKALSGLLSNQDMERCSFFIIDAHGMLTNVTGLSVVDNPLDENTPHSATMTFKLGDGIMGTAASTRQMQYCSNCGEDRRFIKAIDHAPGYTPGSLICAPVTTLQNVLIGVLNISHPQPHFFTDWHMRLLEVYTNLLGQLITNRRLFQQMESQIALRTADLERLVAETRELKDHYAKLSMHDQLTGLHNRRYFYDQVELALARHKRYKNPLCLLLMDIDHFKAINDQHGHVFGDEVLIDVADCLKNQVRSSDILVRFGGEEFVVIFANTGCSNGTVFAERIRNQIKTLNWQIDGQSVQISLSIGLYCLNPCNASSNQELDIDQIIHCADTALYQAKAQGRDRVVIYQACPVND